MALGLASQAEFDGAVLLEVVHLVGEVGDQVDGVAETPDVPVVLGRGVPAEAGVVRGTDREGGVGKIRHGGPFRAGLSA